MIAASFFVVIVFFARAVLFVMMFFVLVAGRFLGGLSHIRLEHAGQAADGGRHSR